MNEKNCFIIHGAYGNPNENWFPWLKQKLEAKGYIVYVPAFPTPEHQDIDHWMQVFEPYFEKINENTLFVGHSLGPAFILQLLEKISVCVKGCFFVSGFTGPIGNPGFDPINKTFTEYDFNWKKIQENSQQFTVFHSENDPYVPLEKATLLANNLRTEVINIPEGKHFNTDAGYTEFKELLATMEKNE